MAGQRDYLVERMDSVVLAPPGCDPLGDNAGEIGSRLVDILRATIVLRKSNRRLSYRYLHTNTSV